MKYKIAGTVAMILMVGIAVFMTQINPDNPDRRVHQHRDWQVPEYECTCDGDSLCTHLPVVVIDTEEEIPGKPLEKKNGIREYSTTKDGDTFTNGRISIINNEGRYNHPEDSPELESDIIIRIRGNSSRHFDKKGYLIKLTDEDGEKRRNEEVLGMDAHFEWALHGPYLDKSLIRNYMWYNIAGEMMDYSPNVRFCEVIINGEYRGLYVMTETITSGKDARTELTEPVDGRPETGYILRLDKGSSIPVKNIETFSGYALRHEQTINIEYPRTDDLTEERRRWIAQDFSDFEKSLYSYDYDTDDYGYYKDINVQSFVDYFIINEFTTNYDAGWLSTYVYKDIGGKINMAVWDFNSACDNYGFETVNPMHYELQDVTWYAMLMKDDSFNEKIIERYRELREGVLSEEYLMNYIDETVEYLGDAIDRNFEVWGYTFDENMLHREGGEIRSHQEAIDQMKNFIRERGAWMDKNIEIITQYGHESKVKKYNH